RRPDRTRKRLHDRAFAASVDKFLAFREYKILPDKGRISKRQAEEKAVAEYDAFNKTQKIDSDFEKRLAAQNRPTRRKRQKDDE
ncbi:MAG: virulence RhuM family protein, partial [Thermoguttaceae bacterium]|nr:virulence RhuM family protein [Thermoguttaceae bacterium]